MKIELTRNTCTPEFTLGQISIDGVFECYTCEDAVREKEGQPVSQWKIDGKTAIPRGTYTVIINHSNHFNRELPLLLNVEDYEGVRIHSGNTAADTEGCILVGQKLTQNGVSLSRMAFDALFDKMERAYSRNEQITIEVE